MGEPDFYGGIWGEGPEPDPPVPIYTVSKPRAIQTLTQTKKTRLEDNLLAADDYEAQFMFDKLQKQNGPLCAAFGTLGGHQLKYIFYKENTDVVTPSKYGTEYVCVKLNNEDMPEELERSYIIDISTQQTEMQDIFNTCRDRKVIPMPELVDICKRMVTLYTNTLMEAFVHLDANVTTHTIYIYGTRQFPFIYQHMQHPPLMETVYTKAIISTVSDIMVKVLARLSSELQLGMFNMQGNKTNVMDMSGDKVKDMRVKAMAAKMEQDEKTAANKNTKDLMAIEQDRQMNKLKNDKAQLQLLSQAQRNKQQLAADRVALDTLMKRNSDITRKLNAQKRIQKDKVNESKIKLQMLQTKQNAEKERFTFDKQKRTEDRVLDELLFQQKALINRDKADADIESKMQHIQDYKTRTQLLVEKETELLQMKRDAAEAEQAMRLQKATNDYELRKAIAVSLDEMKKLESQNKIALAKLKQQNADALGTQKQTLIHEQVRSKLALEREIKSAKLELEKLVARAKLDHLIHKDNEKAGLENWAAQQAATLKLKRLQQDQTRLQAKQTFDMKLLTAKAKRENDIATSKASLASAMHTQSLAIAANKYLLHLEQKQNEITRANIRFQEEYEMVPHAEGDGGDGPDDGPPAGGDGPADGPPAGGGGGPPAGGGGGGGGPPAGGGGGGGGPPAGGGGGSGGGGGGPPAGGGGHIPLYNVQSMQYNITQGRSYSARLKKLRMEITNTQKTLANARATEQQEQAKHIKSKHELDLAIVQCRKDLSEIKYNEYKKDEAAVARKFRLDQQMELSGLRKMQLLEKMVEEGSTIPKEVTLTPEQQARWTKAKEAKEKKPNSTEMDTLKTEYDKANLAYKKAELDLKNQNLATKAANDLQVNNTRKQNALLALQNTAIKTGLMYEGIDANTKKRVEDTLAQRQDVYDEKEKVRKIKDAASVRKLTFLSSKGRDNNDPNLDLAANTLIQNLVRTTKLQNENNNMDTDDNPDTQEKENLMSGVINRYMSCIQLYVTTKEDDYIPKINDNHEQFEQKITDLNTKIIALKALIQDINEKKTRFVAGTTTTYPGGPSVTYIAGDNDVADDGMTTHFTQSGLNNDDDTEYINTTEETIKNFEKERDELSANLNAYSEYRAKIELKDDMQKYMEQIYKYFEAVFVDSVNTINMHEITCSALVANGYTYPMYRALLHKMSLQQVTIIKSILFIILYTASAESPEKKTQVYRLLGRLVIEYVNSIEKNDITELFEKSLTNIWNQFIGANVGPYDGDTRRKSLVDLFERVHNADDAKELDLRLRSLSVLNEANQTFYESLENDLFQPDPEDIQRETNRSQKHPMILVSGNVEGNLSIVTGNMTQHTPSKRTYRNGDVVITQEENDNSTDEEDGDTQHRVRPRNNGNQNNGRGSRGRTQHSVTNRPTNGRPSGPSSNTTQTTITNTRSDTHTPTNAAPITDDAMVVSDFDGNESRLPTPVHFTPINYADDVQNTNADAVDNQVYTDDEQLPGVSDTESGSDSDRSTSPISRAKGEAGSTPDRRSQRRQQTDPVILDTWMRSNSTELIEAHRNIDNAYDNKNTISSRTNSGTDMQMESTASISSSVPGNMSDTSKVLSETNMNDTDTESLKEVSRQTTPVSMTQYTVTEVPEDIKKDDKPTAITSTQNPLLDKSSSKISQPRPRNYTAKRVFTVAFKKGINNSKLPQNHKTSNATNSKTDDIQQKAVHDVTPIQETFPPTPPTPNRNDIIVQVHNRTHSPEADAEDSLSSPPPASVEPAHTMLQGAETPMIDGETKKEDGVITTENHITTPTREESESPPPANDSSRYAYAVGYNDNTLSPDPLSSDPGEEMKPSTQNTFTPVSQKSDKTTQKKINKHIRSIYNDTVEAYNTLTQTPKLTQTKKNQLINTMNTNILTFDNFAIQTTDKKLRTEIPLTKRKINLYLHPKPTQAAETMYTDPKSNNTVDAITTIEPGNTTGVSENTPSSIYVSMDSSNTGPQGSAMAIDVVNHQKPNLRKKRSIDDNQHKDKKHKVEMETTLKAYMTLFPKQNLQSSQTIAATEGNYQFFLNQKLIEFTDLRENDKPLIHVAEYVHKMFVQQLLLSTISTYLKATLDNMSTTDREEYVVLPNIGIIDQKIQLFVCSTVFLIFNALLSREKTKFTWKDVTRSIDKMYDLLIPIGWRNVNYYYERDGTSHNNEGFYIYGLLEYYINKLPFFIKNDVDILNKPPNLNMVYEHRNKNFAKKFQHICKTNIIQKLMKVNEFQKSVKFIYNPVITHIPTSENELTTVGGKTLPLYPILKPDMKITRWKFLKEGKIIVSPET